MRLLVTDTGSLGLLAHPRAHTDVLACQHWARVLLSAGVRLIVPGIDDYELRRELARRKPRRLA
jgi:hypothetical protein